MLRHFMMDLDFYVLCYVDDFIGIELAARAWASFDTLERLFRDTGAIEALDKAVPPTDIIECLGTGFNLIDLTMFVIPSRRAELLNMLVEWADRTWMVRQQLESLIGKLQFVTNCVRPGRVFLHRLINRLSGMERGTQYIVTEEIRLDIKWWLRFLEKYSCVSLMQLEREKVEGDTLFTDASGHGIGALFKPGAECFRAELDMAWISRRAYSIVHLEMLSILCALKCWAASLHGLIVKVRCDNASVVEVINNYRAYDV